MREWGSAYSHQTIPVIKYTGTLILSISSALSKIYTNLTTKETFLPLRPSPPHPFHRDFLPNKTLKLVKVVSLQVHKPFQ